MTTAIAKKQDGKHPHGDGVTNRRRPTLLSANEVPLEALTWKNHEERESVLFLWQTAVMLEIGSEPRCLKLAWSLQSLFKRGFAYPSDKHLSRATGVPSDKISEGLGKLETIGAIIRTHSIVDDKRQRRIWPSQRIIADLPPTVGGNQPPEKVPTAGGQKYTPEKSSRKRLRTHFDMARARTEGPQSFREILEEDAAR